MRTLLFALAMASAVPTALAHARASTPDMTCGEARVTVAARRAVVLGTGQSTYARFVSRQDACDRGETTEPAFAPTVDDPQCFVGYLCRDIDLDSGR
jgi:hypothetical protein